MIPRVKICGITNVDDAVQAAAAGADIIGFVFAAGPRRIDPAEAQAIAQAMPAGVLKAGVFVDEDPVVVERVAEMCGLGMLQFHGGESPEYCSRFGDRAVKAVRVRGAASLRGLERYKVPAILLDTYVPGRPGGTGRTFNWQLAAQAAIPGSLILSGGLNPGNVAAAIKAVRPDMVDVSSGVETAPGQKSASMMQAFVRRATEEIL